MMTSIVHIHDADNAISNDNYRATAALPVSAYGRQADGGIWGEPGGCVFKVGHEMYFVPTRQVAEEDMLYITCDAQKIEGPMDGWCSRLSLGDIADHKIEDAILDHLHSSMLSKKKGEAFVVTRDGKTFRL